MHIFTNANFIDVLILLSLYQGNLITSRLVTILKQGMTSVSALKINAKPLSKFLGNYKHKRRIIMNYDPLPPAHNNNVHLYS